MKRLFWHFITIFKEFWKALGICLPESCSPNFVWDLLCPSLHELKRYELTRWYGRPLDISEEMVKLFVQMQTPQWNTWNTIRLVRSHLDLGRVPESLLEWDTTGWSTSHLKLKIFGSTIDLEVLFLVRLQWISSRILRPWHNLPSYFLRNVARVPDLYSARLWEQAHAKTKTRPTGVVWFPGWFHDSSGTTSLFEGSVGALVFMAIQRLTSSWHLNIFQHAASVWARTCQGYVVMSYLAPVWCTPLI